MSLTHGMLALAAAMVLAAIHVFAGKLRFLHVIPRSRWLSGASGVSVAYVFLHLLPELASGQQTLRHATRDIAAFLEHHIYLIALLGLATFYGLERVAKRSRRVHSGETGIDRTHAPVFWLHVASYATYNALVGYLLLHRLETGVLNLWLFATAMAVHFVVTDYGLRQDHKERYARYGRAILAAAVLLGWGIGMAFEVSESAVAALLGFLAGGVILNVLKEELPAERESRFGSFLLGMLAYAAILLAP